MRQAPVADAQRGAPAPQLERPAQQAPHAGTGGPSPFKCMALWAGSCRCRSSAGNSSGGRVATSCHEVRRWPASSCAASGTYTCPAVVGPPASSAQEGRAAGSWTASRLALRFEGNHPDQRQPGCTLMGVGIGCTCSKHHEAAARQARRGGRCNDTSKGGFRIGQGQQPAG